MDEGMEMQSKEFRGISELKVERARELTRNREA